MKEFKEQLEKFIETAHVSDMVNIATHLVEAIKEEYEHFESVVSCKEEMTLHRNLVKRTNTILNKLIELSHYPYI